MKTSFDFLKLLLCSTVSRISRQILFLQLLDKVTLTLALQNGGQLCSKSDVFLDFDVKKFERQKTSKIQTEQEDFINQNWSEICLGNSRIYNASKFRLSSFELTAGGGTGKKSAEIQVGITSYKVNKALNLDES